MLPDTTDLIQALLIPAAGAGLIRWRKGPSDDEVRRILDGFRVQLRTQFDADRERLSVSRAKLEALAIEWAPRAETAEIGIQIAEMLEVALVAPLAQLTADRKQDRALLGKVQASVVGAIEDMRPALRPDVMGWVEDGQSLADENITAVDENLRRARQVVADFRTLQLDAYLQPMDSGGRTASIDEAMPIARRMMAKYRNALRELAK